MTDVFRALSDALASLLGTTSDIAGYMLGTIVIITLLVVLTWALGEYAQGFGFVIVAAIGFMFAVLVGWFPMWTVVVMMVFIALVIVNPFESHGGGM